MAEVSQILTKGCLFRACGQARGKIPKAARGPVTTTSTAAATPGSSNAMPATLGIIPSDEFWAAARGRRIRGNGAERVEAC